MRRLLIVPLLLLPAVLAACGSTPSASGNGATSKSRSNSASSTTAPATSTTSGSTASTSGSGATVPAVADPTNLQTEPVISPGNPPPPAKLVTKDLVVGTGATAAASSTVVVKYVGAAYTTGVDFTSSTWTSGQAATFALSTVVPGFKEGIVGMKVGGRREIVIPPALGYGSRGSPPTIKANETLVFVVDLESVK